MKVIAIIRHAKSSWDYPGLADHDRPLNTRGERDAPRMAKYLIDTDYQLDRLIVSSAVRAQQTARSFQAAFSLPSNDFITEPELYHAGMQDWIKVLERYWQHSGVLAYFAHNPGITNIVNWLCDEDIFNIPTCGTAIIGFSDDLSRLDSGVATLLDYQVPKKL